MNWLQNYKVMNRKELTLNNKLEKNYWRCGNLLFINKMESLMDMKLSDLSSIQFKILTKITEEEFIKGKTLTVWRGWEIYYINIYMVKDTKVELRKMKLNNL